MKTLMLIPVYNSSKILPVLFRFLYKLDPQPELYVFAENNSHDNTLELIRKFKKPHKVIRVWFRKDAVTISENRYVPIAHVRQLLLTFARCYDPDYAIFLDSDVCPRTKELINNLTTWKKDIVGGSYLRPFPEGLFLASKWEVPEHPNARIYYRKPRLPLDEPHVTSAGCMCLSRKIIQDNRINFYPMYREHASEDFGYCLQAREQGYKIYLDSTAELIHFIPEKIPPKPWCFNTITRELVPFAYEDGSEQREQIKTPIRRRKMKIGLLSTRFFGVPPIGYSGLEQIVWDLAYSLDKLGHEVTLFAPEGSMPPPHGKLVETGKAIHGANVDWLKVEREAYEVFKDKLLDLDILHGHNWFGFEYLAKKESRNLRVMHTHHGLRLDLLKPFNRLFKLNLVGISDWALEAFARQGFTARRCYNGIAIEKYAFQQKKGERFMFLGRICSAKGPHVAIEAAKKAGVGLDVIGATKFVDDVDYVSRVKGLCDGEKIKFIGEVTPEAKIEYLQNAKGLLIPSRFGEPFGLISVEAMACGTVPIALDDGALREIIIDGRTGFVCNSANTMAMRLKDVDSIDPKTCRERAEQFSREKMAEEYLTLYSSILDGQEW